MTVIPAKLGNCERCEVECLLLDDSRNCVPCDRPKEDKKMAKHEELDEDVEVMFAELDYHYEIYNAAYHTMKSYMDSIPKTLRNVRRLSKFSEVQAVMMLRRIPGYPEISIQEGREIVKLLRDSIREKSKVENT